MHTVTPSKPPACPASLPASGPGVAGFRIGSKDCWILYPLSGLIFFAACADRLPGDQVGNQPAKGTPVHPVRVVNVFPHDPGAFSQGLVVEGETLYEGTGQYGNSTLRKVDLSTGKVLVAQPLNRNYFGEGIATLGDRIYQLTWKERVCIVYDKKTMQPLGVLNYQDEGWGLTNDEQNLYLSDGTSTLRVMDPSNLRVIRTLKVRDGRRYVDLLNELEFVEGYILANIWYEDRIAKIDPQTGQVVAWIDCSSVYPPSPRRDREHVLNGIAYDSQSQRLFITGKNWPNLYEIQILASP